MKFEIGSNKEEYKIKDICNSAVYVRKLKDSIYYISII